MKVHLRNIKMEICEKEKYEVGNICNKEEYAPYPYFDLFLNEIKNHFYKCS